ncbi:MAG: hypothetical protein ACI4LM_06460 [Anaerovoracaceae bacterium]
MENRFDRIFELKSVEGIGKPVSVESGMLVRDNETGLVVIRLKMQNTGNIRIGAVKVRIDLFSSGEDAGKKKADVSDAKAEPGTEAGSGDEPEAEKKDLGPLYYAYNDMDIAVGATFGEMTLIPVPAEQAAQADSFTVVVEEVAYRTGNEPVRLKAEPLKNGIGMGVTQNLEGTSTDLIHDLKPEAVDEQKKHHHHHRSRDVFRLDRKDAVNDPKNLAGIIIIGLAMICLLAFFAIEFFL